MFKKKRSAVSNIDKPIFVISAIRIYFGGALEVLNDFLLYINDNESEKFHFIVLVYKKELYKNLPNIEFREYSSSRKSFVIRLWMEYIGFYFLSLKLKPEVWLSMQDSTPIVRAKKQFTYWHSPLLQRGFKKQDLKYDVRLFFLTALYKYVYSKNINANTGIFVQQHAMSDFLKQKLSLPAEKLHVAPLTVKATGEEMTYENSSFVFLYPSFPYVYKNFKQVINAAKQAAAIDDRFEIWLTANGNENKYVKELFGQSHALPYIKWIGYQSAETIKKTYGKADALIYVSEYETWGIPISVFKKMKKPIITADLPYAHETVGEYRKVKFVPIHDVKALSECIISAVNDELIFDKSASHKQDVLFNWNEVFEIIVNEKTANNFSYNRRQQLRPALAESL